MATTATLTIHESQFPENVRRDLLRSLRTRKINHKFHYDSVKQTQKWLELHQRYSPSRREADCRNIYDQSFEAALGRIRSRAVHLVGLGCGGGQKDTRLLRLLRAAGKEIFYTPCDVSTAMVLTARRAALAVLPERNCFPFVCDLAGMQGLAAALNFSLTRRASRLVTFFGMIPNFEPGRILPKLASLIRPADGLLFSANLAPGKDYAGGTRKILPQYDNPPTRDWLMAFLLDLGVEKADGRLRVGIETSPAGLKRIAADFCFERRRRIGIQDAVFDFRKGEKIRLFFSYRYTPERICRMLAGQGLEVSGRWLAKSGEEGVFLCQAAA